MSIPREPSRRDLTPPVLTAADRCDHRSCSAQARLRFFPVGDSFVQMCKHHADEIEDKILDYRWIDERHLILGS